MKRLLCLIIAFCMILSLVSCSAGITATEDTEKTSETETKKDSDLETEDDSFTIPQGFSVGWAREIISPENGTGLGGYGKPDTRLSQTIADDLKLTCTAVSDGENVILLFSADLVGLGPTVCNTAKSQINKAYGIPTENIFLTATHTHSAPTLIGSEFPNSARYTRVFYLAAKKAAGDALKDLENATILAGKGETENLNFVRRYVYKATGTYAGGEVGDPFDPAIYAHESQADPQLQIIKFDRATKKDVILCNWQCHPTGPGGASDTRISADWIGSLRDTVEKEADVLFSYHQGGAGNIGQSSRMTDLPKWGGNSYIEHGREIAKTALAVMQNLSPVQGGKIQVKHMTLEAEFKPEIVSGEQKRVYSNKIALAAVTVGDLAFTFAPGEPHDTVGKAVKNTSPLPNDLFQRLHQRCQRLHSRGFCLCQRWV